MNNTGSDSPADVEQPVAVPESRRVPTRIIVLGVVALVLAVVIGSQVIGVLYAIFFPPAVPVPEQVTLVTHNSTDYGVDDWLYSSTSPACDLVRFYEANNGQCRVAPLWCTSEGQTSVALPSAQGQNVARCQATQNFSIFALSWEVVIATGSTAEEASQFRLNREIYWTGAVPPYNPPTLDEGFPAS